MPMRRRIISWILTSCFLFISAMPIYANSKSLDKIVAIVNSQAITASQVNQQMQILRSQLKASGAPVPEFSALRLQALDHLIDNALQLDVAKKAKLTISQAQVDEAIANIAAQNHISVEQLKAGVASQGMSYATYRQQIHDQLVFHQVQQSAVASKVKVTPQDIAQARKMVPAMPSQKESIRHSAAQYHVIDVLVSTEKKANALLAKIKENGNPARVLNNNPEVKVSDLGFRSLSEFPDIFAQVIPTLNPGQFSHPVKAPNGNHILMVAAVRGKVSPPPVQTLTPEQIAYQKKFEEALDKWLHGLRNQSYIKIF